LEAVTWEADATWGLLWTMERKWRGRWYPGVSAAVGVLATSPLLSVSALARARRLYGLRRLSPIRAETTAVRRRAKGGPHGRPRKVLTPPFAELLHVRRLLVSVAVGEPPYPEP
jgi:hypothetical protein